MSDKSFTVHPTPFPQFCCKGNDNLEHKDMNLMAGAIKEMYCLKPPPTSPHFHPSFISLGISHISFF